MCMAWNVLGVCAMSSWVDFLKHCYNLVDLVLDLELWSTTLVIGRQLISEEIWDRIQFMLSFVIGIS